MEQLTREQQQIAQSFTPDQVNKYSEYRAMGFPAQNAFNLVSTLSETKTTKRKSNVLNTIGNIISEPVRPLGEAIGGLLAGGYVSSQAQGVNQQAEQIRQDISNRIEQARQRGDTNSVSRLTKALQDIDYGYGVTTEYTENLPSNREVVGSAIQTAATIAGAGIGGQALAPASASFTRASAIPIAGNLANRVATSALQEGAIGAIFGAGQGLTDPNATTGDVLEDAALGGAIGAGIGGALPLIGSAFSNISRPSIAEQVPKQQIAQRGTRSLRDFIAEKTQSIRETLSPSIRAENIAERARTAGVQNIDENILRTATARGFSEADSTFLSTLSEADKKIAAKLQDIAEKATVDSRKTYGTRPIDVVGDNLVDRIKPIQNLSRTFGKQVDEAAKSLEGQVIDNNILIQRINNVLEETGIVKKGRGWNFTGSRFEFVPNVQKQISKVLNDTTKAISEGDAYRLHNLKKSIDEAVDYAKNAEGLTGSGQNLLKSIRRNIDDVLDETFPSYNEANNRFRDIADFIDELEGVFGKTVNKERAANRLRRLFSNAESRGDVRDFLARLDDISSRYGIETEGNLLDQLLFTEILEKVYGTQAITSLQGEVQKAIRGVQGITQGIRDPIRGAGQLIGSTIENIAGQTDEARKQFLRNLLKQ